MSIAEQIHWELARFETMYPDGIAWTLEREGVKGTPDDCVACVLANYLNVRIPPRGHGREISVQPGIPTGFDVCWTDEPDDLLHPRLRYKLPDNLLEFVKRFDNDAYPALMDEEYRESWEQCRAEEDEVGDL